MKKNKFRLILILVVIVFVGGLVWQISRSSHPETQHSFQAVRSISQLEKIYSSSSRTVNSNFGRTFLTMPWSFFDWLSNASRPYYRTTAIDLVEIEDNIASSEQLSALPTATQERGGETTNKTDNSVTTAPSKDFSTTNLQVENVDEADVLKTDGDFIYSLANDQVIITDVRQPQAMTIAAKITPQKSSLPIDLLLFENQLIVISETTRSQRTTVVSIYDLSNPTSPQLQTFYQLEQRYFTSRLIEGKLIIIASGQLEIDTQDHQIETVYYLNDQPISLVPEQIHYLPSLPARELTAIVTTDLTNLDHETQFNFYLMSTANVYLTQQNFYLLNQKYDCLADESPSQFTSIFKSIFTFKGLFGLEDYYSSSNCAYQTNIYKFSFTDHNLQFQGFAQEEGKTINQFSLDEYQGNLRVAMNNNYLKDGAKVVIFDQHLQLIGRLDRIAPGEKMYSSRFIGPKVYLVTYQTIDPLFVIDLSDPTQPNILGELKIPGYSTYLHPYDENHLLGFGIETQENVRRDRDTGRVISTSATTVGMKIALFDVSEVTQPRQIAQTVIGDNQTTSAVLTNHKALLFSKEKNLLAIPVNNYSATVTDLGPVALDGRSSAPLVGESVREGYLVYDLTLETGFQEKGLIIHQPAADSFISRSPTTQSSLLRGLYIADDLFTVSQFAIKVNQLSDLRLIDELTLN